jgi:uncharacterized protein (TIGR03085 family)
MGYSPGSRARPYARRVTSFSKSERSRLCDTALAAGADAPTLCGGWTVKDLVAHLVVREGDPLAAPGIVLKPLAGLTRRAMNRLREESLERLVRRLRRPPLWSPYRIAPVDRAFNTLEFYVHHEDIRRAVPAWEQRSLEHREQAALWKAIGYIGRGLVRPAEVPVAIAWAGSEHTATLSGGSDPVTVTGSPGELVLFLFGRDQTVGLELDGPPESVARLRKASLGL